LPALQNLRQHQQHQQLIWQSTAPLQQLQIRQLLQLMLHKMQQQCQARLSSSCFQQPLRCLPLHPALALLSTLARFLRLQLLSWRRGRQQSWQQQRSRQQQQQAQQAQSCLLLQLQMLTRR
jgi:hypothetical protein